MNETAGETKQRILDAAERLFAADGVTGTSLRSVIREADVNLAAVHYHFGSKDALVNAVIARHFQPLNRERLRRLDEAEQKAGKKRPPVERVIEAFVAPTMELCADPVRGQIFMKLIGRLLAEPQYFFGKVVPEQMADVRDRFVAALERAVPGLSAESVAWRMTFTIGAMAYSMRIGDSISALSGGRLKEVNTAKMTKELVRFTAAGWKANAR